MLFYKLLAESGDFEYRVGMRFADISEQIAEDRVIADVAARKIA
jgi:hypothetical protein